MVARCSGLEQHCLLLVVKPHPAADVRRSCPDRLIAHSSIWPWVPGKAPSSSGAEITAEESARLSSAVSSAANRSHLQVRALHCS